MSRIDEALRRAAEYGKGATEIPGDAQAIEDDETDRRLAALAGEPFPIEMPARRAPIQYAEVDSPRRADTSGRGAAPAAEPARPRAPACGRTRAPACGRTRAPACSVGSPHRFAHPYAQPEAR